MTEPYAPLDDIDASVISVGRGVVAFITHVSNVLAIRSTLERSWSGGAQNPRRCPGRARRRCPAAPHLSHRTVVALEWISPSSSRHKEAGPDRKSECSNGRRDLLSAMPRSCTGGSMHHSPWTMDGRVPSPSRSDSRAGTQPVRASYPVLAAAASADLSKWELGPSCRTRGCPGPADGRWDFFLLGRESRGAGSWDQPPGV
jgi:hypothetical protein